MKKEPLDNEEGLEASDNFEAAYKSYSKPIYNFLYWRTKNVQLSEDLTSTVFEKAWQSRDKYQDNSARAWFYRIARNVLIDHWRKKKELVSEHIGELEETRPSTAELIDKDIEFKDLRRAINKLPKSMKLVIQLRFIEGLSSKQIAEQLNISEANVRVIQYRSLKKLREYLR